MCLANQCCCCIQLQRGVQSIALAGFAFSVLYILLSLIGGGRELFLLLNYFDVNHVYVAIFFWLINFFVHLLLWRGATDKQKYQLLPWLVFIIVKAMMLISVGISVTSQYLGRRFRNVDGLCPQCLEDVQMQLMVIGSTFTISALHLYFWIVVYSLYAKLSVRYDLTLPSTSS